MKHEMRPLFLVAGRSSLIDCVSRETDEAWYLKGFDRRGVTEIGHDDFMPVLESLNGRIKRELLRGRKVVVVGDEEGGLYAAATALEEPRVTAVTIFTPFDRTYSLNAAGREGLNFLEREAQAVGSNIITVVDLTRKYTQTLPGTTVHNLGVSQWRSGLITNKGSVLSTIIQEHAGK